MSVLGVNEAENVLRLAHRIAVLGIKPESCSEQAAHYIPAYLASVGYELIPVPIRFPDVKIILDIPVFRSLLQIKGSIDILSLFLRPKDVPKYEDDIIAVQPSVVWFQSGLLNLSSAERFEKSGMRVVHCCIGCLRASIEPVCTPFKQP